MFARPSNFIAVLFGLVTVSTSTPTSRSHTGPAPQARPNIQPSPFNTGHPAFVSPARQANKTCSVPSSQNSSDSSPAILAAFQNCNNGGTIVLDGEYTVASPLNLTFLRSVDVALTGTVSFTDDINYWTGPQGAYNIVYQNSSTFWLIGGTDVNIYGGGVGVLNGNGEKWWNGSLTNSTLRRPILFVTDGLEKATISGLNFKNPPNVSTSSSALQHCDRAPPEADPSGSTSSPTAPT